MKKIILVLCILMSLSCLLVFAEDKVDMWKFEREIISSENTDLKSIMLDEDIYRNTKEDLSDIRIVNSKDEFVPYYIESNQHNRISENKVTFNYSEKILTYNKNHDTFFDFKLTNKEENKDFIVNELILNLDTNQDFSKQVIVYGSYDNQEWQIIKEDNIFNIRSEGKSKNNINFKNDVKYNFYRVVILKNIEDINIDSLWAMKNESNKDSIESYKLRKKAKYNIVEDETNTVITILNPNLLKIFKVQINAEGSFNREYKIYNSSGGLYNQGVIHSDYNGDIIDISQHYDRFSLDEIKIIINNKDDRPIDIKDIEISYNIHKLTFKVENIEEYRMLYGNDMANKPSYDIEYYKDSINNDDIEIVRFGDIEKNVIPSNESIDTKLILNIVIVLISLILVFFIIKNLKN